MNLKNFLERHNRVQLKVEGKNLERFIKRLITHKNFTFESHSN